jgi:hypothetical protein
MNNDDDDDYNDDDEKLLRFTSAGPASASESLAGFHPAIQ